LSNFQHSNPGLLHRVCTLCSVTLLARMQAFRTTHATTVVFRTNSAISTYKATCMLHYSNLIWAALRLAAAKALWTRSTGDDGG
jgi:hypothetical protein